MPDLALAAIKRSRNNGEPWSVIREPADETEHRIAAN
jgi:hypothetical protein